MSHLENIINKNPYKKQNNIETNTYNTIEDAELIVLKYKNMIRLEYIQTTPAFKEFEPYIKRELKSISDELRRRDYNLKEIEDMW